MSSLKNKKIVIVSESFYPLISGVAVMTGRLARYLVKQGNTVSVLTPSRSGNMATEERDGYSVYRLRSWPFPLRKGFRITLFPDLAVRKLLDDIKPDLIHIHDPALTSAAVARYARKRGIPVIGTHHFSPEFMQAYLPKNLAALILKVNFQLYNRCNLLTVPSETVRRELLSQGEIDIPIHVLSNGVDIERFSQSYPTEKLRTHLQIPEGAPVVAYLGRVDPDKNVDVLLKAFSLLRAENEEFYAIIAGSGNDRERLHAQAVELGVNDRIRWITRIDHESPALNQLFCLSDIFCIPSIIETESIVTMEAMAAGLPILAAERKALPELVDEGKNGFLLEPDDIAGWAARIRVLLNDKDMRTRMGKASQQKVQPRNLPDALARFVELYESVLTSKNQKSSARKRLFSLKEKKG